ncbi:LLM class flavin-dependent oxidoreductase [[Mycobacterium] burgundiense]|uniref:LLM class flavin-dependent oxidoreductase n=1 Tax=[Mycobacterium] burgundiense TaxID=3064286 RepID=A0ABM9LHR1_9MYCO|nr:LLM class flavin-dependent oxidoreductase [Mycolicibacterium sp. MU0053]CAJ1499266.1 LLM class flavin-dependent oxidoreductase [Mycolicibacterium sp. MU0053]
MTLTMSCILVPDSRSAEHARHAKELGYAWAWFYDSPALYTDVWMRLCQAAERTSRIGLGTSVIVPSNRHPMTTASAIATLVDVAGDRVCVGVGTGFTARVAMGQPPLPWADVEEYVATVQALLRGEVVDWEGAAVQMLHSPGLAPPLPIEVPIVFAADGPKGQAVARRLGDGVFATRTPVPGFDWSTVLTVGTVLGDGESPDSERVLAAAGHAGGVLLHFLHTTGQLPPEDEKIWLKGYEAVPADRRHLAMHYGHLVHLNEQDKPYVTGARLAEWGLAMSPEGWANHFEQVEKAGGTEVAYQPAGPDIRRELEAFSEAFHRYSGS